MAVQKEEVVISGIGGVYPECDTMEELKYLLFNKTNGITIDSRRWIPNELGVVSGTGKLKNVNKFDATFFSAHPKLAEVMDAITRIFIERSIEAIFDAGLSPADLHGTNTAVFSGSAISETEMYTLDFSKTAAFSMLGRSKTMQANRVSYILNLIGPSYTMDGGWICGSNALEKAKNMIENGFISSAIVGVTNLALRPETQLQFQGLNRLNQSFQTKSFSSDADGYNRSEACIVMYLQKASEAKRSYGTLLSVRSVQFGDHEGHITEHNGNNFKTLLLDSYTQANIDPASVEYIEAYGSGIKSEDAMELNIMEEVFCTERRNIPLKVGSVKSNIGHCEVSGLFMSIVKSIIILESGYIPPNINFSEPNNSVAALKNGKIQVITEKTPFKGDIIGVSSFGFSNAFSHVILKKNNKVKEIVKNIDSNDYIPRLILASGRNEENARATVKKINYHGNDPEYLALTNDVFTRNINAHFFRSFSISPNTDESRIGDVWNIDMKKRKIWFVFSGMGSQWQGMGTDLLKIPVFADAIEKCDIILKPRGIDIKNILTSQDPKLFDNILNSFVGIAAVQIGLVEVLRALDITPDGIIGHSVGELGCAYADGCFTAEEMILAAYARGQASLETDVIPGMMAAIGLGYEQIKNKLPHDIDVACRNSATSCTISGPVESINEFVSKLKSEGVFAKSVNAAGIAFHSRYIQSAGPTLLKYLKDVIKVPKKRTSKWVSTSLPETEWESDLAKYSSPEYHTNNLLSSVLFEDGLKHIPSDAIAIEIAPHGLLQAILKKALPETVINIPLTKKVFGDSIRFLLTAIGKMYTNGVNPKINSIYPKVTFPVSRGTPCIQSLPFWDHNEQWTPVVYNSHVNKFLGEKTTSIIINDSIHLIKYQIHGVHIIPFSYMLINVWEMFVEINSKTFSDESVQFDNLRFKNNIKVHPNNIVEGNIMIQWGSGHFEYYLNDEVIFSGQIRFLNNADLNIKTEKMIASDITSDEFRGCVLEEEIYAVFENNGFNLGDDYKNITKFDIYKNYIQGNIKWKKDWIYFFDGLLKFPILEHLGTCPIETPISIRQISINPTVFKKTNEKDVSVNYNTLTKEITCDGINITGVKNGHLVSPKTNSAVVNLQEEIFIQFNLSRCKNIEQFIYDSMDIITDNFDKTSEKLILCTPYHFDDQISKLCTKTIKQIFENKLSMNNETLNWNDVEKQPANDESRKLITVTSVNYLQDTMRALVNIKCSYIIVCSKKKLQDLKDWKIITQQQFDSNNCLGLMKKAITVGKNIISIKPTNDVYDLSIWRALETYNSSKNMIYIISRSAPLEGITTYVKEMLHKYKSKKLRFVFILDSKAPDFDSHQSFYTHQLSKDLVVNIFKNGGWGFYKRIVLQDLKDNIKVNKNLEFKNVTTNPKNKLAVKYLGLNFKDLVVEESTENEFGLLEYSGYVDTKTIMGITSLKEMSSKMMIYDPLLSWPVPSTWSLEDATTVPLTYAMTYYVFNILCHLQKKNSILVTSGLHPIGQAAIAISLGIKCETYAIVESDHQAEQLSSIFPELSRSKILINTNDNFDVQLKMITKSKGIDIILNFLNGNAFQAAFRALAIYGNFFHFSKSDMKNQNRLGTRPFLQNMSFFAVSSNMLLNESDHNKQIVHQAFMDGLNKGVVKPMRSRVVTSSFGLSGGNIFDTMRSNASSVTSEKVVLSLNNNINNDESSKLKKKVECNIMYECHPDKIYLIVGNRGDWIDLAEWLVERGAQKIVIVVKRCLMSSNVCRRFDRLVSQNVSIQIESDLNLKTKEESLNWLNYLTNFTVLDAIFIVNQIDINKMNNLRYAFEKHMNQTLTTSFVCILSNGSSICAELKSIGFNAFNISWDGMSSTPTNIAKILPSLDILLQKSFAIDSSSFVCSEPGSLKSEGYQQINNIITNILPESRDELHCFNDIQTQEAEFIEVSTRSPRLSQLKSAIPVFLIPGFKPELIRTFYEKLGYPVFEAQLPEDIGSIDEISQILVNKLKKITNQKYVSLIGETWGGTVALKMAQILEAEGILTTVTLLEGDPEILAGCAKHLLSNEYITKKLNSIYGSLSNEISIHTTQKHDEEFQLRNMSACQKQFEKNSQKALNTIRSRLQALLETKPLSNKIQSKVVIFRYEKTSKLNSTDLKDYCINPPFVHIISGMDYKHMMVDKKMIEMINNNVAYSYPTGVELPLCDKYKNFYFYMEKYLKNK